MHYTKESTPVRVCAFLWEVGQQAICWCTMYKHCTYYWLGCSPSLNRYKPSPASMHGLAAGLCIIASHWTRPPKSRCTWLWSGKPASSALSSAYFPVSSSPMTKMWKHYVIAITQSSFAVMCRLNALSVFVEYNIITSWWVYTPTTIFQN